MPRIFDNIEKSLLPALTDTLNNSHSADFCVGYFNHRGWKSIDSRIEQFGGREGKECRLLVGMQNLPKEDLQDALKIVKDEVGMDNQSAIRIKRKLAEEFRQQLTYGIPTAKDEAGLRRLANQLREKKVVVKLFLKHSLHAKLYLCYRDDANNPRTGFVGSSNLTFAGLSHQGELNVDVLDLDATKKLEDWFNDRWNDNFAFDITEELIEIIENSWAGEELISPYHIYLKMAYHLSREAISGIAEFKIPREFQDKLFEFQAAAVQIAAHHLHKRGGVLIGDVVGLGKTFIATALARIFYDDFSWRTLILCPANLRKMWADYCNEYLPFAIILSHAESQNKLRDLKRFQLVIIDESHNLRNRDGKRYKAIQEYIYENDSKIIMLSATPYNLSYLDLASQLRLFLDEDVDVGIRPENYLSEIGEVEFIKRHQCPLRSISAFEKSSDTDDWRELMRLYMVRRTRSFIKDNYAKTDSDGKQYLVFPNGDKSYFPKRIPKTVKFKIDSKNPDDQYARMYSDKVIDIINNLTLPRYGLGNYILEHPTIKPTNNEQEQLDDLSRAGKRLIGFSRTNLFKRMESSGYAFVLSVIRQLLRNYVFIYAAENELDFPIGAQESELFDTRFYDEDEPGGSEPIIFNEENFKKQAAEIYKDYIENKKSRYKWVRSNLFNTQLKQELDDDSHLLLEILNISGEWKSETDEKLKSLEILLSKTHHDKKILLFSQYADTVNYLNRELQNRKLNKIDAATGGSSDPTTLAYRFSPVSNEKTDQISKKDELRILLATDVLSEGQNLQDSHIVVNYDLPWAIIRLIQRAGRVDRIGQKSEEIFCYSFLPAEGVENIIKLRKRLNHRLKENAEVVGTDETFFENEDEKAILNLYNEKSGIMDGDEGDDVDLASYAFQIWKNAIEKDSKLENKVKSIANVSHATKSHISDDKNPDGVLVYVQTVLGSDALTWVNSSGKSVTESQYTILKAAECEPEENPLERRDDHYDLEKNGVLHIAKEQHSVGGQLGRPSGARFKSYERLKSYSEQIAGELWDTPELQKAIEEIYNHPLRQTATDTLNRQMKSGISDDTLATLVILLSREDRLCIIHDEEHPNEPQIVCSMGLK